MNFKALYNGVEIIGCVDFSNDLNDIKMSIENKYNLKVSDCDCFFINN